MSLNDPTVEKLRELLKDNPRGLLLIRDELSGLLRSFDKQGREGDREFYLECPSLYAPLQNRLTKLDCYYMEQSIDDLYYQDDQMKVDG